MQTNVMLFKTTDAAQLRADLQTHVDNKDLIFVTHTTPSWVLDMIVKKIKKDIENRKPVNVAFYSRSILQSLKFSKRPEINQVYIDLFLQTNVYENPQNIVLIADPKKIQTDDFKTVLVHTIHKIEKVYDLKDNDFRSGVIYIPDTGLCWENY